jgi:5'-nucleotidase
VHLALTGMLDYEPDIVVSGINNAANLGDDVIYSGTVSAAMEGRLGLPAVAVSLVTHKHQALHYETAARAAVEIVARLKADPLQADTILNVNVPDLPWEALRGEVTRLATAIVPRPASRRKTRAAVPSTGSARPVPSRTPGPGTSMRCTGCISITPIFVDLTRYEALDKVAGWVDG